MKVKIKNKLYFVIGFLVLIGICKIITVNAAKLEKSAYATKTTQLVLTPESSEASSDIDTDRVEDIYFEVFIQNSKEESSKWRAEEQEYSNVNYELLWTCLAKENLPKPSSAFVCNYQIREQQSAVPSVNIHQMGMLRI